MHQKKIQYSISITWKKSHLNETNIFVSVASKQALVATTEKVLLYHSHLLVILNGLAIFLFSLLLRDVTLQRRTCLLLKRISQICAEPEAAQENIERHITQNLKHILVIEIDTQDLNF